MSAHFAQFVRMWGLYAHLTQGLWVETAERRGAYGLSGGGRRLLHELGRCTVEARAVRVMLPPEAPFGA